jgi:hypothetical protein
LVSQTCQFLEQENAWESGGLPAGSGSESFVIREDDDAGDDDNPPPPPPPRQKERQKMEGERTLLKGILSTEADFEVLVSGPVGVKEIDRLIQKLELDKEILAEKSKKPESDADDLM